MRPRGLGVMSMARGSEQKARRAVQCNEWTRIAASCAWHIGHCLQQAGDYVVHIHKQRDQAALKVNQSIVGVAWAPEQCSCKCGSSSCCHACHVPAVLHTARSMLNRDSGFGYAALLGPAHPQQVRTRTRARARDAMLLAVAQLSILHPASKERQPQVVVRAAVSCGTGAGRLCSFACAWQPLRHLHLSFEMWLCSQTASQDQVAGK